MYWISKKSESLWLYRKPDCNPIFREPVTYGFEMDGRLFSNLPATSPSTDNKFSIAVYLFEEFCFLSFSAFVDFLLAPKHSESDPLVTASWFTLKSKEVPNSLGIKTNLPLQELKNLPMFDALILIGGQRPLGNFDANLGKWINHHLHQNRLIYACGSGTEALAQLGFLDNREVAVHHNALEGLKQKYPAVSFKETVFELDKDILTFAIGSACVDAFSNLAKQIFSKDRANSHFRRLEHRTPREAGQLQRSTLERLTKHKNRMISMAGMFMSQNLSINYSGRDIAENIGISRRQLERLFKKHIGISPGSCYLRVRLELALELFKATNLCTEEIINKTGFLSNDQFYRLFRKQYGVSLDQKLSAFGQLLPCEGQN